MIVTEHVSVEDHEKLRNQCMVMTEAYINRTMQLIKYQPQMAAKLLPEIEKAEQYLTKLKGDNGSSSSWRFWER